MNHSCLKTTVFALIMMAIGFTASAQSTETTEENTMQANPAIQTIPNLKHPADNVLTGGQPSPEALQALKEHGTDIVVNLRGVGENDAFNEESVTEKLDLAYYTIPIASAADLDRQNAKALDDILARHEDQQIVVHCASGNRVGALFALRAAWLHGKSIDDALEIGREHGLTGLEPQVAAILADSSTKDPSP